MVKSVCVWTSIGMISMPRNATVRTRETMRGALHPPVSGALSRDASCGVIVSTFGTVDKSMVAVP